jgi:hypothetical protein
LSAATAWKAASESAPARSGMMSFFICFTL